MEPPEGHLIDENRLRLCRSLKSLRANSYLRYGRELHTHTVPPPPRDKLDCQLDRYKAAFGTTLGRNTTMYGDSSAACVDASSCGVITQLMYREYMRDMNAGGVRKGERSSKTRA